jgi:hypothetical protein
MSSAGVLDGRWRINALMRFWNFGQKVKYWRFWVSKCDFIAEKSAISLVTTLVPFLVQRNQSHFWLRLSGAFAT